MLTPYFVDGRAAIFRGDCMDLATLLAPDSIDSLITDPPAGVGFMGKDWDGDKGGRVQWAGWLTERLTVAYRFLKPGAHGLVWALPRTSHWTACGIEDAGFEIRDRVSHLFGTGFPKSMDISKAIDAALKAERRVIGANPNHRAVSGVGYEGVYAGSNTGSPVITAPGSAAAALWAGWGTALKPACEDWWLIRKPLDGTYAHNVLTHGVGGLNIGACRIGDSGGTKRSGQAPYPRNADGSEDRSVHWARTGHDVVNIGEGRWPAHLVLSHSPWCGMGADPDECALDCPVRLIDEQSGAVGSNGGDVESGDVGYKGGGKGKARKVAKSKGGASRFFYVAKGSKSEKSAGLDHITPRTGGEATDRKDGSAGLKNPRAGAGRTGGARNFHPTVKGVDLMRWLVRLITPPGGIVVDMFTGSGTTGVAALLEGCNFIGAERDEDDDGRPLGYMDINVGRVRHALGMPALTESVYPEDLRPLLRSADDNAPEEGEEDPE